MIKEKSNCLNVKIIKDRINNYIPTNYKLTKWARQAFKSKKDSVVVIKVASRNEIMKLNKEYFKKDKSCNVLSFPLNEKIDSGEFILGDIIVCPMIINQESSIFGIERESRWAHMIIHSMLHLQGFTHDSKKTQKFMEDKERELMSSLGYSDPYYAS